MGWAAWCWDLWSLWLLLRAGDRQVRRPTSTYRAGTVGKVVAVAAMVLSTTVIAGWILPLGALWILYRPAPHAPVSVPMADGWPGQK